MKTLLFIYGKKRNINVFLCNFSCIVDNIWKCKNNIIFRNGEVDPDILRVEMENTYSHMSCVNMKYDEGIRIEEYQR